MIHLCKMEEDTMSARKREKGGKEYVCFFCIFVFGFKYWRGISKGSLWLGDANLLILFLHRDIGIRAGCRQEKCHAKKRKNVGHSIGQLIKDYNASLPSFFPSFLFELHLFPTSILESYPSVLINPVVVGVEKEANHRPLTQSECDLQFTMRFSPVSFPGLSVRPARM